MAGLKPKIVPHLWFDSEAEEAARLYTSLFDRSAIGQRTHYGKAGFDIHGQPEGKVMTVPFDLDGWRFMGLNAGPVFRFNPSVSLLVRCEDREHVDRMWNTLIQGGSALMELGQYPFSERYGWLEDQYGLSWQLSFDPGEVEAKQSITPAMMFVGEQCGRAEQAMNFYASLFSDARVGDIYRYEKGREPDREGTVVHGSFTLAGQQFAAMDSAHDHAFSFNEAISFMVYCDTQEEIDYYWNSLSAHPEAEQCGWLKDRYGLSWQITPRIMDGMLADKNSEKTERLTDAFLKMKKFDIEALKRAFDGR